MTKPPPKDSPPQELLLRALTKLSSDFQALSAAVLQWRQEHQKEREALEARIAKLEQAGRMTPRP